MIDDPHIAQAPGEHAAGDGARFRIAVLQLPGVNCEPETARALRQAGLAAEIVRWTRRDLASFDGYVLPGGFSFQDRVRAGAVAAHEPVVAAVRAAAADGRPVLGICNGAQVLVEAGLVPGLEPGRVEMALAPNDMPSGLGYYCAWTHVRACSNRTAATCALATGEVVPMPVAHAEGRFTTRDPEVRRMLASGDQVVLRYCRAGGEAAAGFPHNPNGSLEDAAAIANPSGNVVAMMPHPERAARLYQVAWELAGPWGARHRAAQSADELATAGPGLGIFRSLRRFLEQRTAPAAEGSETHA